MLPFDYNEFIKLKITGTQIAYSIVCLRKLWLFSNYISFEHTSQYVELGKIIDQISFKRDKKYEWEIGDTIKVDFIKVKDGIIIHEIKKSKALEEAHKWQVKYYIFYLKNKGIKVLKGIIHYPKIFRKIEVNLNKKDENLIKDKLIFIKNFLKNPKPPPVERKKYCKKCAYFEFCFI